MIVINSDIENHYRRQYKFVAGVDEAGRGSLAGPVVAAAVILPDEFDVAEFGITDSKKLSEKKRDALYDIIIKNAIAYSAGFVHSDEIEEINILQATMKAMHLAINGLSQTPDFLLIDGNYFKAMEIAHKTIVKGDLLCPSISAASIIAKVTRDRWMNDVADKEFPEYEFCKNKGYGVKSHFKAIRTYGRCEYHRNKFLTKFDNLNNNKLF